MPRLLVPRSCLPLVFLDPNGTSGELQGNRVFSAKIKLLEATLSPANHLGEPVVLIAESSVTHCFYAVEQVRPGTYALCQLCAWVTLKDLEKLILGSKPQPQSHVLNLEKAILPGDKWWHKAAIQSEGAMPPAKRRKSWMATGFQLCLNAPVHQSSLATRSEEIVCETRREEPLVNSDDTIQDLSLQSNAQTADEILDMIRTQYQEALYMSQVRSSPSFDHHSNTDRLRHHWRIMRKDHYLALARSFKGAIFRLLIVVSSRNSLEAVY